VRWFAWYPVPSIDGVSTLWLRWVERRKVIAADWFIIPYWIEYRRARRSGT
jgi:hypothetical protein